MGETKITSSDLLILGLIAEMPRHAYELGQVIEDRGMREWTEIGFSSVYYVCNKLNRLGLVEADLPATAKARKRYVLTVKGREMLNTQSLRALRDHRPNHASIILGMIHWAFLEPERAVAALHARSRIVETERLRWERERILRQPLPDYVDSIFDFSLGQLAAEAAWIEGAINDMSVKAEQT